MRINAESTETDKPRRDKRLSAKETPTYPPKMPSHSRNCWRMLKSKPADHVVFLCRGFRAASHRPAKGWGGIYFPGSAHILTDYVITPILCAVLHIGYTELAFRSLTAQAASCGFFIVCDSARLYVGLFWSTRKGGRVSAVRQLHFSPAP